MLARRERSSISDAGLSQAAGTFHLLGIDFLLTGREAEIAQDTRLRARIALIEELPRELRDHVVNFLDAVLQAHQCLMQR